MCSMCCRNISEMMLEEAAYIARPSVQSPTFNTSSLTILFASINF